MMASSSTLALAPTLLALLSVLPLGAALSRTALRQSKLQSDDAELDVTSSACASLANQGTYFTVDVDAGTPGQPFSLVADTGSNNLIIPSCACLCSTRCFTGTNKSSTFQMDANPSAVELTFGSGTIDAVIVTDVATVGGVTVTMNDALLLMIASKLDFSTQADEFEGILGLGLPQEGGVNSGFLDFAQYSTFSMCFNEGKPGVLNLGSASSGPTLGSIGSVHWGLNLQGISIGDASIDAAVVCGADTKASSAMTACGLIPDSGTTLIMGPQSQINTILAGVCDGWSRCQESVGNSSSDTTKASKAKALLLDCGSWLSSGPGLNELPTIYFHVAGSTGSTSLEMEPWSYVFEASMGGQKACEPMFYSQDYTTNEYGPIWIMGMPLFYEYNVQYNTKANPPSISFTSTATQPCGSCGGAGLVSDELADSERQRRERAYHPRKLGGRPRMPSYDLSKGF